MKTQKKRNSQLRGLYRALILTARQLGYRYRLIEGEGSWCYGFSVETKHKRIDVGRDQSLANKIVALSHEIGHALDFTYSPPSLEEVTYAVAHYELFQLSRQYYGREKAAWVYAKKLLLKMRGFGVVQDRFRLLRRQALGAYYYHMKKHEGNFTDNPG